MGYTWVQFMAYRQAATRRLARQQRDALAVMNAAFNGGKNAVAMHTALDTEAEG